MGTRKRSALGDIRGKVGTIVLTKWMQTFVVKGLPAKTNKVSVDQQYQRVLFGTVTKFLSKATSIFQLGYQLPKKANKSKVNLATSYHLFNAVIGEYPDFALDPSKMKFTNALRPTENGLNAKVAVGKDLFAEVTWEHDPFPEKVTRLDDQAVLVIYGNTEHVFFTENDGVQRRSLSLLISHAKYCAGHEFFCWLFFISADGKFVSEAEYLGMINIIE